jgi:hypothetical protein
MADKGNGEKKKARGACLVNKTNMERGTNYAHALGFKVTGFDFRRDGMGMTVEDTAGAKRTIDPDELDDLDRAIEQDNGDD